MSDELPPKGALFPLRYTDRPSLLLCRGLHDTQLTAATKMMEDIELPKRGREQAISFDAASYSITSRNV